ncbi:MAG: hypothetical protein J1F31_06350 [Erysipelotrichales bacterium]|nr:hypothetical protein [Erysipelotrichales bacterium]
MNKLEEFREFAKTKPFLKTLVENGTYTWQDLFERYDIYGSEDEVFKEEKEEEKEESEETTHEEKKEGLGSILDAISGFDADKISDGLNGMKKILGILSEVTKPDEAPKVSKRKMSRPYQRNDD